MRRQILAAVVLAVVVTLAGCGGLVFGDGAQYHADPAAPSEDALADAEYETVVSDTIVTEEEVEVADQHREIVVTSHVRAYQRTESVAGEEVEAGMLATVSTPAVDVMGISLNPIAGLSNEDLVDLAASELNGGFDTDNIQHADDYNRTVLDETVTVSEFETTTTHAGEEVDVSVYVATVQHGDDYVVAIGAHPAIFPQERLTLFELFESIEHPVDEE